MISTEKTGEKSDEAGPPSVLASVWRTPDGTRKEAVTAVADEPQTIALTLDSRYLGPADTRIILPRPNNDGTGVELAHMGAGRISAPSQLLGED